MENISIWVFSFVLSSIHCLASLPVIHSSSAAGEDTLIGINGRDFIILGADSSIRSSISLTSTNVDKIRVLLDPFPTLPYPFQHPEIQSTASDSGSCSWGFS